MFDFAQSSGVLNFDALLYKIARHTHSEPAKQRVLHARPFDNRSQLLAEIHLMRQFQALVDIQRAPWQSYEDIRPLLKKIEPQGSFLEISECQTMMTFLDVIADLKHYFKSHSTQFPELTEYVLQLDGLPELLSQLQYTIEPSGTLFDNASRELKQIRRKLNQLRETVHKRLQAVSLKNREHLQEDFITLRDGRLVLPVRAFSANKIAGIVHGQSASGATRYVEPMAVVEINNEIQELLIAERNEEIRILKRLAEKMRSHADVLRYDLNILVETDARHARVLYARSYQGVFPQHNDTFAWEIHNGYHPLLLERLQKETVPLSLSIGEDFNILVISGPNAGGKTVTMKTVGMLQLMYQCAIPMPVDEASRFPLCEQLFVVIGDQQSLENDLSTFSSHIDSLRHVLEHVDHRALVLIDEIGIGTEPGGGAALAIAILEQLNRQGIVTIVSTHQNPLKIFASETDGVENGAMQYDVDALRPLFVLQTGIPGSSFTFDIGKRFGLPEAIIERARDLYGDKQNKIDALLADMTRKSARFHEALREVSLKESELAALEKLYRQKVDRWEKEKKKIEKEARSEAARIVDEANRQIEHTIRVIRESKADKARVKEARQALGEFKKQVDLPPVTKHEQVALVAEIKPGDKVRSRTFGITGRVGRVFKGREEVELERDGMKLRVAINDLERMDEHGRVNKPAPEPVAPAVGAALPNRLDLRGLDTTDALSELESYMDGILHAGWKEVTIVHGKGTGALRKAVQNHLRRYKDIRYRTGRYGEGDTGVTIVTLVSEDD